MADLAALREQARKIIEADPTKMAMRSCWNCNPAHERLKEPPHDWVMMCFSCGHYYFAGEDITEDAPDATQAGGPADE